MEKQLLLAQKMEAIGTLAAGVAHDLNNVLSGIVSYPDLLLMQVDEKSPLHRQLRLIQQSGEKAAAIVQDMLTLGRRGVINYEPVDLGKLVELFMQSPEYTSIKRHYANVLVETRVAPDTGLIVGSQSQLTKTLMNLVANAAEALSTGGVITIELDCRVLDAVHDGYVPVPPGEYAILRVSDTRSGIAEEDLEHIFEPFYTKKKMGRSGTGLGLAVVWGVVRDNKGFVDVTSRKKFGARFDLYFPLSGHFIAETQPTAVVDPREGMKAVVLVVDDVSEQREVAVELLQALGYQAQAVSSGEAALQFMETQAVDLLLLDMVMDPGIDGLETFVRALAINPHQRAVIASGYTKSDRVDKALALGGSSFLRKPYRMQDLAKAVHDALKD